MTIYSHLGSGTSFHQQLQEAAVRAEERRARGHNHSEFWLKNIDAYRRDYSDPVTRESAEYLMQLASIRRAISNFVRIVTGKDISVRFSTGQQSYAAGHDPAQEYIVISATNDPDKLDVNVGLALHEAAHLVKSRVVAGVDGSIPLFEFLKTLGDPNTLLLPPSFTPHLTRLGMSETSGRVLVKTILNIMEDRRIDMWMYETALGYRQYYDAKYAFYWNKPRVRRFMEDPRSSIPTVLNYRFHITNMTHPGFDVNALPQLPKIMQLIDMENIQRFGYDKKWLTYPTSAFPEIRHINDAVSGRVTVKKTGLIVYPLPQMPEMVRVAVEIVEIILADSISRSAIPDKKVTVLPVPSMEVTGKGLDEDDEDEPEESLVVPTHDPDNLDMGDEPEKIDNAPSEQQGDEDVANDDKDVANDDDLDFEKDLDNLVRKQDQILDGTAEQDALNEKQGAKMTAMEEAHSEVQEVRVSDEFPTVAVIVHNKMTAQLLASPDFHFSGRGFDPELTKAIERGLGVGNLLAHRLRIMADERPLVYTRQTQGKIDRRLLAGVGYDLDTVFQQTFTERFDPVFLHLSIDSSGSMEGTKFEHAIAFAAALAQAAHKIKNLDIVISFRASTRNTRHPLPEVLIAYDSRTDTPTKIRALFPLLRADGGTPEGLAFAAIKDQIIGARASGKRYFINLSDGYPDYRLFERSKAMYYNGAIAFNHTARQVQDLRDVGIQVLSYYIHEDGKPSDEDGFRKMYGEAAAFIDPTNIMAITRTLNKLFLSKDS